MQTMIECFKDFFNKFYEVANAKFVAAQQDS